MSVLTDVMDRLKDISSLRTQVNERIQQQRDMRSIMLTQQRELAEVPGQLKALIQMQRAAARKYLFPLICQSDLKLERLRFASHQAGRSAQVVQDRRYRHFYR